MYRLLESGEVAEENDECFILSDGGWCKVQDWGKPVSDIVEKLMPIRRKKELGTSCSTAQPEIAELYSKWLKATCPALDDAAGANSFVLWVHQHQADA